MLFSNTYSYWYIQGHRSWNLGILLEWQPGSAGRFCVQSKTMTFVWRVFSSSFFCRSNFSLVIFILVRTYSYLSYSVVNMKDNYSYVKQIQDELQQSNNGKKIKKLKLLIRKFLESCNTSVKRLYSIPAARWCSVKE